MGVAVSAVGEIARKVLGDNDATDGKTVDEVKDVIDQHMEMTRAKLDHFYDKTMLQTKGAGATTIPICSVVDSERSLYSCAQEKMSNAISETIVKTVDSLLGGKWKKAISDLVSGSLQAFLGPTEVSTTGSMLEKECYHIVWSNNAMIRLDIFVTKCQLSHHDGHAESNELYGGYIMVISVVDMQKINWQIFLWEFSRFYAKIKEDDENAYKDLKDDIAEASSLLGVTGGLFHAVQDAQKGASEEDKDSGVQE